MRPSDTIRMQYIWTNIGSGNVLFPDGTKPLTEPMLTTISSVKWNSSEGNFTRYLSSINMITTWN